MQVLGSNENYTRAPPLKALQDTTFPEWEQQCGGRAVSLDINRTDKVNTELRGRRRTAETLMGLFPQHHENASENDSERFQSHFHLLRTHVRCLFDMEWINPFKRNPR